MARIQRLLPRKNTLTQECRNKAVATVHATATESALMETVSAIQIRDGRLFSGQTH